MRSARRSSGRSGCSSSGDSIGCRSTDKPSTDRRGRCHWPPRRRRRPRPAGDAVLPAARRGLARRGRAGRRSRAVFLVGARARDRARGRPATTRTTGASCSSRPRAASRSGPATIRSRTRRRRPGRQPGAQAASSWRCAPASRRSPKRRWNRSTIARRSPGSERIRSTGCGSNCGRSSIWSCRSDRRTPLHSTRYYLASVISYAPSCRCAIAGRRPAGTRPRRARRDSGCSPASAVAVCLVFFPQERFRIPVIDPALAVLARHAVVATAPRTRRMKLLIVLPTYNERPNIERVTEGILQHDFAHLLVVDDGSPDGTGQIADALAARHPGRVEVLHRQGPRGLGLAYVDGLKRALETDADAIGQMDADLSHDPKYLPDLVAGARPARSRHRIALPARHQRRELAAPPDRAERVRQSLHPRRDGRLRHRLHERLSRLAARRAGAAAARQRPRERLRVSHRDAVRGRHAWAAASAKCRSSSSSGRKATRRSRRRCSRIAAHAVAAAAAAADAVEAAAQA